jgi:hypothetical protein
MPDHRAEVTAAWDEGPLMRGIRLTSVASYRPGQALRVYHEGASAFFALATAFGKGRSPELLLRRGGGVADAEKAAPRNCCCDVAAGSPMRSSLD